jgi:hypothetical protein
LRRHWVIWPLLVFNVLLQEKKKGQNKSMYWWSLGSAEKK